MNKIYRVLGEKGRITIPFELRENLNVKSNDILSFSADENQIIITKEKICDNCNPKSATNILLNNLSCMEKKALLKQLLGECDDKLDRRLF